MILKGRGIRSFSISKWSGLKSCISKSRLGISVALCGHVAPNNFFWKCIKVKQKGSESILVDPVAADGFNVLSSAWAEMLRP